MDYGHAVEMRLPPMSRDEVLRLDRTLHEADRTIGVGTGGDRSS